jgi:hypothetical protein
LLLLLLLLLGERGLCLFPLLLRLLLRKKSEHGGLALTGTLVSVLTWPR